MLYIIFFIFIVQNVNSKVIIDLGKGTYLAEKQSAVQLMEGWISNRLLNASKTISKKCSEVIDISADDEETTSKKRKHGQDDDLEASDGEGDNQDSDGEEEEEEEELNHENKSDEE